MLRLIGVGRLAKENEEACLITLQQEKDYEDCQQIKPDNFKILFHVLFKIKIVEKNRKT